MKKILISGGGTGGHIYPALSIAEQLSALEKVEFLYLGTQKGLESTLVPRAGYPFKTLSVQGLERKFSWQTFVTLYKSVGALWEAEKILREFKPDIVIGTGGYVCGPVLLCAALHKIPTLIQEQNVIPGITNKILSRFVDKIAVGYEEARNHFGNSDRIIYTGNPVRPSVLEKSREEARRELGLGENEFVVLIAGGSRGARSINQAMLEVHQHFRFAQNIKIIHATGNNEFERVCKQLEIDKDGVYSSSSSIVPYLHDMPTYLAAVDLAIFRAGAVGLAELAARGIPSILIPYPYASEDHQTYNAQAFVLHGAAKMIVDKVLTGQELILEIENLQNNRDKLLLMAKNSKEMGKPEAARHIAEIALSLVK